MNTKRALAAVLLSLLAVAGCGTRGSESTPQKPHTAISSPKAKPMDTEPTSASTTPQRSEEAFLVVARVQPMAYGVTDSDLIALGDSVCGALSRGVTDVEVMATLEKTYNYETSGQILAASRAFLCPDS